MTETNTDTTSGSPGGLPGGDTAGGAGGSFVRTRAAQMAATMQPPAEGNEPAADAGQQRQQQEQPRSQEHQRQQAAKIRVGDADFTAEELQSAIAAKAEADILKNSRPKSEAEYQARNSANFKLPEDVKWEFNEADPLLAQAKNWAFRRGLDQETFSEALDMFAASRVGELQNQATMRQRHLDALGAAGPQRVDAVARWLNAKAGQDGAAVASFIKQYPSAPFVKAVENLIRQFSSQGGADYSSQHRESADAEPGKIPGYDNMSFSQRRAAQMQERMRTDPNYARGQRPGGRE